MIVFDNNSRSIEDIVAIAMGESVALSSAPEFERLIHSGSEFLDRLLREEGVIYGVTTGYGDSCTVSIPMNLVDELPAHLYTFHGCGLGEVLSPVMARAVMAVRLQSLCQGMSGVSLALLQRMVLLLEKDILPVIPREGSVGASGDLTPLSYVAAVLCGEREVFYQGERRATESVYAELNITPLKLRPKEGLALMNGTAVMTAIACLAFDRARYLAKLSTRITALATLASKGNAHHFDEILFSVKPHPGQQQIAAWLRDDLHAGEPPRNPQRLQDRYSLRCAPHVIGVLQDALPFLRQYIENEINSANDNPIIDGVGEHVLHGGHFYGGHIAFAMDSLKNAVANLADLLDRQLAMVVDTKFNHGLPANLSGASAERRPINHGFKAVQIGASAWTAEALKLTMPASVFSRSTECHNQDKVSMGTISARDCIRVLELTEQVTAATLLAMVQGIDLRILQGELARETLAPALVDCMAQVRELSAFVEEDRALESELRAMCRAIGEQKFSTYTD
ncbi:aromatic amino acid ammonia-lyase [Simiduia curdlanivorans]|uniref:Histidine ammonia-lyase n=1 Tax=Simiduia curdlanivorans TaxID=1492769 RepID=A0ABV8V677_9GAMM|nr:aromatic amino acid ammonia-lyase [Simiduia curdlanivorans]MDN3640800.1 aromatic amino acid ammonia-lyase [Simiduia curdlanivorans]